MTVLLLNHKIIDPRDELQYFTWVGFALAAAVYSALVFRGELSKKEEERLIFSKRNTRSALFILASHLIFLGFLLALIRVSGLLLPSLPDWITNTFPIRGADVSIADLLFMLVAILLYKVERRWLIAEVDANSSG